MVLQNVLKKRLGHLLTKNQSCLQRGTKKSGSVNAALLISEAHNDFKDRDEFFAKCSKGF